MILTLYKGASETNLFRGGGRLKVPPALTRLPDEWERQTKKQIIVECKERMISTGFTDFLPVFTGKTGKYR